jgi:hypothetical protein
MSTANPTMAIVILSCLISLGCHGDMKEVWAEGSGRVPASAPAPEGFKISPHEAQVVAEKEYGMRKTIQHVYANSQYYYIVDGFFGSSRSKASKVGVRVNGKTGAHVRIDRP